MHTLRAPKWLPTLLLLTAFAVAFTTAALAQDTAPAPEATEAVAAEAAPARRPPMKACPWASSRPTTCG